MEKWKDVVGYEGIYEVSNLGRIRTKENKTTFTERHGKRIWKQRILKQKVQKENNGCRVELYKNGKGKTCLVHRLVAKAFIPEIEGKLFINHIDGVRTNNRSENLEWCNSKENVNHAFDTGLSQSHHVTLLDLQTNEEHHFRSKAKADEFLGRHRGFLSAFTLKGRNQYESFRIFIEK